MQFEHRCFGIFGNFDGLAWLLKNKTLDFRPLSYNLQMSFNCLKLSILKGKYTEKHILQVYIFNLGIYWNIWRFTAQKTPYLTHTGSLCSPLVQPLSEICHFSPCLLNAPLPIKSLCRDWHIMYSLKKSVFSAACILCYLEHFHLTEWCNMGSLVWIFPSQYKHHKTSMRSWNELLQKINDPVWQCGIGF